MKVQKTKQRKVITNMHGHFQVKETVHVCVNGCRYPVGQLVTSYSKSLNQLVAPGANFGYDLEVRIGLDRFLYHRQRLEIQQKLKNEGINISTGTISNLAKCFLRHLEILHNMRSKDLRKALTMDGGYPLHIDATGEEGRGTLLVAYAGWKHWVLGAWKISSERSDIIEERIKKIINIFGYPCAFVRDLGRGMQLAIDNIIANSANPVPVLACHYHFLKDVGKDLLEPGNSKLRNLFRQFKIRPNIRSLSRELGRMIGKEHLKAKQNIANRLNNAGRTSLILTGRDGLATIRLLCQWVLDYANNSKKLEFPFAQPYLDFFNRCSQMYLAIQFFRDNDIKDTTVQKKLEKLAKIIKPVNSEVPFTAIADNLKERVKLFNTLRDLLRLSVDNKNPNTKQIMNELQNMEQSVNDYIQTLHNRLLNKKVKQDLLLADKIVLKHLKRHNKYLWGHAIYVKNQTGERFRLVDRTNNILEDFFKKLKCKERRRSGRKLLAHDFENIPAAAALVKNLIKEDYVKILCGNMNNLPKLFSEIDSKQRYNNLMKKEEYPLISESKKEAVTTSFPYKDRKFVRKKKLHELIETAAEVCISN